MWEKVRLLTTLDTCLKQCHDSLMLYFVSLLAALSLVALPAVFLLTRSPQLRNETKTKTKNRNAPYMHAYRNILRVRCTPRQKEMKKKKEAKTKEFPFHALENIVPFQAE